MDKIEKDKDLEKASKEYVKDIPTFKDSCLMKAAFEDGWLCCKEHMMEGAVEGNVIAGKDGEQYIQTILGDWNTALPDKVRVIVIKEEEE